MPALFDLLYRDYCRARLAEMRKQLWVSVASNESPETNWDASDPFGLGGEGSAFHEGAATKKPQASGSRPS